MRLRRVRLKGGADVHVLRSEPAPDGGLDWRGRMVEHARTMAGYATEEAPLVGYIVLGMYADGRTAMGYRYKTDEPNVVPRSLLPAWVAEVLRRDIISGSEARDVFNEMFEWREG